MQELTNSKISVIFDAKWTSTELFSRIVQNILFQTKENLELIILDKSDNIEILKLLNSYNDNRIRYVNIKSTSDTDLNIGIIESSGDYITFIDTELLSNENRLKKQASILDSKPEIGFVTTYTMQIDNGLFYINQPSEATNCLKINSKFLPDSMIFSNILFRKNLIEQNNIKFKSEYLDAMKYKFYNEFCDLTDCFTIPEILSIEKKNIYNIVKNKKKGEMERLVQIENMSKIISKEDNRFTDIAREYHKNKKLSYENFLYLQNLLPQIFHWAESQLDIKDFYSFKENLCSHVLTFNPFNRSKK